MNNVIQLRPIHIGDLVQIDLGHDIHTGLVTVRYGNRYRVRFPGGNTLLIRAYDVVNNLTNPRPSLR